MSELRPRAVAHRGVIRARGFVLDPALIGEATCRRRILDAWQTGARLFRVEGRYVLLLEESVRLRGEAAIGEPLICRDGLWLTAPLTDSEIEALDVAEGALVWIEAGRARSAMFGDEMSVEPAEWIELDGFELVEPSGFVPEEPPVEALPEAVERAARGIFADFVPPVDARAEEVQRALRRAAKGESTGRETSLAKLGEGAGAVLRATGLAVRTTLKFLFFPWMLMFTGGEGYLEPAGVRRPTPTKEKHRSGGLERWFRQLAARLLNMTQLSRLVGRKQAKYMQEMVEMFRRGDLDEALKHAIPLDADLDVKDLGPTLWSPSPRENLELGLQKNRVSSALFTAVTFFEDLQEIYSQAFEELERRGEIEKAAFVLLELLDMPYEAVSFLETHERFELAAKIAEGRELSGGMVVRLWFLAGDVERALLVARRTGAFAGAVSHLEQSDPDKAKQLRLFWADHLASAGDFGGAVSVIWPVEEARHIACEWLDRGIDVGGALAARMYVWKASLLPGEFDSFRKEVFALLDDTSNARAHERRALVDALRTTHDHNAVLDVLRRKAARMMVAEELRAPGSFGPEEIEAMAGSIDEFMLYEDVRRVDFRPVTRREPVSVQIAAEDCGAVHIHDAARLPDGRLLVALGDAGMRVVSLDGRTIARFDQPSDALVISDSGDRAIAIKRLDGRRVRLTRVDLVELWASHWCYADISRWADSYDGSIWFVARVDTFIGVDAMADDFSALWRVAEVGGWVSSMQRSEEHLSFVLQNCEVWNYELPSLMLRERAEVGVPEDEHGLNRYVDADGQTMTVRQAVFARGQVCRAYHEVRGEHLPEESHCPLHVEFGDVHRQRVSWELGTGFDAARAEVHGERVALLLHGDDDVRLMLLSTEREEPQLTVQLDGASYPYVFPGVRFDGQWLTLWDERGRLLNFDAQTLRLDCDLRLS
ncbi:hypothetical protein FIV42_12290 [Persicimonas caeni]|uniref:MoxR-vWA-beta-propeller ternary system domain-containing protein n=1 Tax=Persicimonas caeni TaxID=2292766 RepID=A0A4Y6PUR4_PERCE|nr:bpX6 domain-containing protein [Persicimonas caeni]QDG51495.1 hypothetical protein FIV42_12290 [Persicimonas caeni]QED32716.1 hypothetical protein FRD00_12285 [Persicimonas caeni]